MAHVHDSAHLAGRLFHDGVWVYIYTRFEDLEELNTPLSYIPCQIEGTIR